MKQGRRFTDKAERVLLKAAFFAAIALIIGTVFAVMAGSAFPAEAQSSALGTQPVALSTDPNRWTTFDTVMQIGVNALIAVDWMQTYRAQGQRDRFGGYMYEETGWAKAFIGKHPSGGKINSYMAICSVAHPVISVLLPKETDPVKFYGVTVIPSIPARSLWQGVWFGIEADTVVRNYKVGIRIRTN